MPEIYLNSREVSFYQQKFVSDKPILLLQTNGGAEQQPLKYSWARDIPSYIVQSIKFGSNNSICQHQFLT